MKITDDIITIRGFWTGPPLTNLHRACLRSFLCLGHKFILYSYDPLVLPEGICLQDANQIVPKEEIFYYDNKLTQKSDIAPFADYFRLRLLHKIGGWYCDVDTVCLSSHLPRGPRVWARQCPEFVADSVSNGQLFFEKNDPLILILLEKCESLLSNISKRETLGPPLISSVLRELDLPCDMGATAATFYPIRWIEIFKLWLPEFTQEVEERVKGAVFLPVYQSFPLYVGLDPEKLPPEGSYLSKLLEKFVPESVGVRYSAEEVRELTKRWFKSNGSWAIDWLTSIREPNTISQLLL
jgi:hypothetical protein